MRASAARNDGCIANQWVMNPGVRNQVGLELVEIDIECTVEPEARCDRANDLSNQAVQVFIIGPRNVQVTTADVIDCFVVDQKCAIGVFDGAVCRKHSVIGFDDGSRDPRGWIDDEFELRLLAVVGGEAF